MQVILTEDMGKLGTMGTLVDVKPGYARNFLLPQKKAVAANPKNVASIEHQRRLIERNRAQIKATAAATAARLGNMSITIARKVGDQEKLFGSVTALDIERALLEEGVTIDRKKITLDDPIRALGVYHIPIKLQGEVEAQLKVWVVAE
jgi:large subunit ribosomal protein L9